MGYPESRSFDSLMAEAKGPLLSGEEERELSALALAGDEAAAAKLCAANIRFAITIAKRYHTQTSPVTLEDLVSAAYYGMMLAAKKYDATHGRFITYAIYWVRQQCQLELARYSSPVCVPQSVSSGVRSVREFYSRPENAGRKYHESDVPAISEETGILHCYLRAAVVILQHHTSLDQPLPDGHGGEFAETRKDRLASNDPLPGSCLDDSRLPVVIDRALSSLPPREAYVIRRHFLGSGGDPSLKAIGEEIGVSRERVRQLKERALEKLRKEWGGTLQFAALD